MGMLAISMLAACGSDHEEMAPPSVARAGSAINFGGNIGNIGLSRTIAESATKFAISDAIEVVGYKGATGAPTAYGTPFMEETFLYGLDEETGAKELFMLDKTSTSYTDDIAGEGANEWPVAYKWVDTNNDYYFYAYYPKADGSIAHDGTGRRSKEIVNLPVPEATSEGLTDEVLWATTGKVTYAEGMSTPSLTFQRKLSKVRFRVQFNAVNLPDGIKESDYTLENISFVATKQVAALELLTGTMRITDAEVAPTTYTLATAGTEEIQAFNQVPVKNAADYNALEFAPLLYGGSNVVLSDLHVTISGNPIRVTLKDQTKFRVEEGKITYVLLTMEPTPAGPVIEFKASIEEWGTLDGGEGTIS